MSNEFGWLSPGLRVGQRWFRTEGGEVYVLEDVDDSLVHLVADDGHHVTLATGTLLTYWELLDK